MTAYVDLQAKVSRDLSDPDRQTFTVDAIKDFIQQGMAELGRLAPQEFQEDIDPVADQLVYPLRSNVFSVPVQEMQVIRVELWQGTPARFLMKVIAKSGQPTHNSIAGWEVWAGNLEIPQQYMDFVDTATMIFRVWGYSPYPDLVDDADVVPVSSELELALRTYCRVEGMRTLVGSRVLFKQWQVRSNNTDVTLGALNSDLQIAEDQWRRLARSLKVIRQTPE